MTDPTAHLDLNVNLHRYISNWARWLIHFAETPPPSPPAPDQAPGPLNVPAPVSRYATSSWFLHRCYRHLMRYPGEDLHAVTGFAVDGCFILADLVPFDRVERTAGSASAGEGVVLRALRWMESVGGRCGGLFHSHPGCGPSSTTPSAADWQNQAIWERAFPVVGAVFSRDAHVRFFASRPNVRVDVHGKKVSVLDENLFRLDLGQGVPLPEPPGEGGNCRGG